MQYTLILAFYLSYFDVTKVSQSICFARRTRAIARDCQLDPILFRDASRSMLRHISFPAAWFICGRFPAANPF
jgi:hypothetical protein